MLSVWHFLKCLLKGLLGQYECSLDISYQRSQKETACLSSQGLAVLADNGGSFQAECGMRHGTGLGAIGNHLASTTTGPCVDIEPLTKPYTVSQGFSSQWDLWTESEASWLKCRFSASLKPSESKSVFF